MSLKNMILMEVIWKKSRYLHFGVHLDEEGSRWVSWYNNVTEGVPELLSNEDTLYLIHPVRGFLRGSNKRISYTLEEDWKSGQFTTLYRR